MFFRTKKSGPRSYLQIVENHWRDGRPRQSVIATVGRLDELQESAIPLDAGPGREGDERRAQSQAGGAERIQRVEIATSCRASKKCDDLHWG